ncbi:MAG: MarR family winged helix-turn-helix transcriptional regulator [Bacteroidota bacterium]
MPGKYELLAELLPLLEEYESANHRTTPKLSTFSIWLSQRLATPRPGLLPPMREEPAEEQGETILTMLISYLFRYAKHYTKKALEATPLSTMDEFTFMATLAFQGSMTKTALIQQHLLEITSGIEIIKRLSKQGYLESFNDPNDGRSKRVKITSAGKAVLNETMKEMDRVAHVVAGNLAEDEREQLLPLLHKLNDFHALIHINDRKSDLEMIEQKYLNGYAANGQA